MWLRCISQIDMDSSDGLCNSPSPILSLRFPSSTTSMWKARFVTGSLVCRSLELVDELSSIGFPRRSELRSAALDRWATDDPSEWDAYMAGRPGEDTVMMVRAACYLHG